MLRIVTSQQHDCEFDLGSFCLRVCMSSSYLDRFCLDSLDEDMQIQSLSCQYGFVCVIVFSPNIQSDSFPFTNPREKRGLDVHIVWKSFCRARKSYSNFLGLCSCLTGPALLSAAADVAALEAGDGYAAEVEGRVHSQVHHYSPQ